VKPLEHVPLAPRTTLGVGGSARWFVEATAEAEVVAALTWAGERSLDVLVLGGGSNLLVADGGFDGLVLRVRVGGLSSETTPDAVVIDAGAGVPWDDLVARAVANGWAGIECLSGIPGDVGATPIQNVGAYGQEVADTIVSVRAVDRGTGGVVALNNTSLGFGYRDSIFKREARDRYVIVGVRFALRAGGAPTLRYAELAQRFAGRGKHGAPSLAEVRDGVVALRRAKSMVLDRDAENGRSAGSFFVNPTVDRTTADAVRERALTAGVLRSGELMPEFPATGDRVKLSAAWLIERAGFRKGTRDSRVGISTKHALAIVNLGDATALEIVAFARRVRDAVAARFGVVLVPEPVMVGFAPDEIGRWELA
jgi:UDP-N-acetylmuramate dehydrogenase